MDAMTDGHDPLRLSLGAYLLGALDPADRAAVEAHLGDCPPCREELAGLAGLPGLLGRLTVEEATATSPPVGSPDEPRLRVLDRTLTELASRRRRQRHRWLAGAAAAVLIAAGGAAAGTVATTGPDHSGVPAVTGTGHTITATDPGTHVHATAILRGGVAGTAITLRVAGVSPGLHCQLIAIAADGHHEIAGSWRVAYHGQADVTGTTAIPAAELAALQVITTSGTRLVTLPAHS